MARNQIMVRTAPDVVFQVLDDAYAYPRWVVGTRRIRHVDAEWPAVGSRFHHAIGTAAGELHDSSEVLARDRPRSISLEVRFRPTGVARVDITVEAVAGGSQVTMVETPAAGFFAFLPQLLTDPALTFRNALSLQRFRHEVERRSEEASLPRPTGQ
jgi:uncharacterized protein YndB with AHSA1/START domain